MLKSIACFDMFAEMLSRGHYRSAAAMFIDSVRVADWCLEFDPDSLDDLRDELSDMWMIEVTNEYGAHSGNSATNDLFHNLLAFTVCQRSQRSYECSQFYESIIGGYPQETELLPETVNWLAGK